MGPVRVYSLEAPKTTKKLERNGLLTTEEITLTIKNAKKIERHALPTTNNAKKLEPLAESRVRRVRTKKLERNRSPTTKCAKKIERHAPPTTSNTKKIERDQQREKTRVPS